MPADVGEEELQAVGRAAAPRQRPRRRRAPPPSPSPSLLGLGGRRRDLEPDRSSSVRQLLDLGLVQVELERERLELGRLEVAALLRALDHRLGLIRLEQLVQLVLRQGLLSPFGPQSGRQRRFSL